MTEKMLANGVHVITLNKNNKFYAMTLAWATYCDYDKLLLLVGDQSQTQHQIEVGDVLGFTACSSNQADQYNRIGETHSNEVNKLTLGNFIDFKGVKVLEGGSSYEKLRVLECYRTNTVSDIKFVFCQVEESQINNEDFAIVK